MLCACPDSNARTHERGGFAMSFSRQRLEVGGSGQPQPFPEVEPAVWLWEAPSWGLHAEGGALRLRSLSPAEKTCREFPNPFDPCTSDRPGPRRCVTGGVLLQPPRAQCDVVPNPPLAPDYPHAAFSVLGCGEAPHQQPQCVFPANSLVGS